MRLLYSGTPGKVKVAVNVSLESTGPTRAQELNTYTLVFVSARQRTYML